MSDDTFHDLEPIKNTAVAPAVGIASIALNFAIKYHDINTVQDGALYQQYKLEGKNMSPLHLDHVFDTAIRMEQHLLSASDRIAKMVIDTLVGEEVDEGSDRDGSPEGGETEGLDPEDDSPVREAEAPPTPHTHPNPKREDR